MQGLPVRKANTHHPDDSPLPANGHIVPRMPVAAVAVASAAVRHTAVVEEPDAASVFEAVAVAATSSAVADSAAHLRLCAHRSLHLRLRRILRYLL